jgi:hypothetical protein
LYGGAAGGGKSYALLMDAFRHVDKGSYRALILRRSSDELRELVQKSQELYPNAYPGAKWRERQSEWWFPSGARLWLTYLDNDKDVMRYQGQAFSYIAFDELTQYPTPFAWDYLRSRLRTTDPTIILSMRATTNPGGPGHCVPYGDVLTPDRGWVDIRDFSVGDKVYTVNAAGDLVPTVVDQVHKKMYSGPLTEVSTRNLSMALTPDHKVAKVGGTRGCTEVPYSLVSFSDLPGQATILRSVKFTGSSLGPVTLDYVKTRKRSLNQPKVFNAVDYMEFVGFYLSEGCRVHRDRAVNIAQCKAPTRKRIEALLDRMGFKYSNSPTGYTIYCVDLYEHMARYGDLCRNKAIPNNLKNAAADERESLLSALYAGDGCEGTYYTTSVKLADDVAEIALKLGYIVYQTSRQREDRDGLSYAVHITKTKSGGTELLTGNHTYKVRTETKRRSDVSTKKFSGYVYCLGIEGTHTFIIRQNGAVWVSGNSWVKKMFIDPAPAGKAFWATNIETGEVLRYPPKHAKANQPLFQRRFIPAMLSDNPYLYDSGDYEAMLLSLPEHQRERLLEGNWDIAEGAAFPEFNRHIHVVDSFEIPNNWRKFRSCDYGYGSKAAVVWFAVTPSGQLVIYRELYVSKVIAVDLARQINRLEANESVDYGILDSSLWHKRGDFGPSIAAQMMNEGCRWRPSDRSKGSRTAGKNEMHRRLQVDEFSGEPGLVILNTCTNTISQLPIVPLDDNNPEDVNTKSEDHIYDAVRYGIMSRPTSRNIMDFGRNLSRGYVPVDPVFGH